MQFASFAEETVLFGATAVENEFIMDTFICCSSANIPRRATA